MRIIIELDGPSPTIDIERDAGATSTQRVGLTTRDRAGASVPAGYEPTPMARAAYYTGPTIPGVYDGGAAPTGPTGLPDSARAEDAERFDAGAEGFGLGAGPAPEPVEALVHELEFGEETTYVGELMAEPQFGGEPLTPRHYG